MRFQRIYNNGSFGIERTIDINQVVFLQVGDKVPGVFVEFKLHSKEISDRLFEVGCSSGEPGFVHRIVAIPQGSSINNEKMVVESN